MKVIITFTFCCDDQGKSKFMALKKPGKVREFFSYFVATLKIHDMFKTTRVTAMLLRLAYIHLVFHTSTVNDTSTWHILAQICQPICLELG